MHVPLENLNIQSQEHPPAPVEGTRLESDETNGRQRVGDSSMMGRRRTLIDNQRAELSRLNSWNDRYSRKYRSAKDRVAELEHQLGERSRAYNQAVAKRDQRIQALEDELTRTKELLAARTTELSGAQSFLSTADRRSEADVLGIVRDLNENIFQVAANLTEEWENYRSGRSSRFKISKENINAFSESFGPALVHQVLDRDSAAVTYLVQTCLCDFATRASSNWRHRDEFKTLNSIHERLSASGKYSRTRPVKYNSCIPEGQAISARWRSLTHSHLSEPPSDPALITRTVADILWITGSFAYFRHSLEFVEEKASKGIKTIERLAMRLESVFMEDIMSCDMYLLCEPPYVEFDGTRMTREVESDRTPTPKGQGKVAGITEVGVEKSICAGREGGRRTQVLLKTKVVLEKDLLELQRTKH